MAWAWPSAQPLSGANRQGALRTRLRPAQVSNAIIDDWAQPTLHYGVSVNAWWRVFWFVLGMAPLLLFLTGLSTWQFRRRTARRRKAARKAAAQV